MSAVMMPRIDWFLKCCNNSTSPDEEQHFLAHVPENFYRSWEGSEDFYKYGLPHPKPEFGTVPDIMALTPTMTPRQRELSSRVQLPDLPSYPAPPGGKTYSSEEERRKDLLETYKQFVVELHTGMYLTQLTSTRDYSDIHCQLMDDLKTLKLDQSNGRIIEFPLNAVSKVYRIVKNDDKWYNAGSLTTGATPVPPLPLSSAEHIVVVEFMRRKLAFVFKDLEASQRFLMCIELLIRRAQIGSGPPRRPIRTAHTGSGMNECRTPHVAKQT